MFISPARTERAISQLSLLVRDFKHHYPAIWGPKVSAELALRINSLYVDHVHAMCGHLDIPIGRTRKDCAIALVPAVLNYISATEQGI